MEILSGYYWFYSENSKQDTFVYVEKREIDKKQTGMKFRACHSQYNR